MFNPAQAAGAYHLNLSDPYEHAIAEELLQLARNVARHSQSLETLKENFFLKTKQKIKQMLTQPVSW